MNDDPVSIHGAVIRFAAVVAVLALIVTTGVLKVTRLYEAGPSSAGTAMLMSGDGAVHSGTPTLTDDDHETALFRIGELLPGHPVTACTSITYTGNVTPIPVRLHARSDGALAEYLDVTIDVGRGGSFGDCAGFTPVDTIYAGTLADLSARHSDWSSGLGAFTAAATPTTRTMRFVVTVQDDPAAEGAITSADFTWDTREVSQDATV